MNFDFQQLLVALIMLVPGFIVTNIQKAFKPTIFSSDFHWLMISLLNAIYLNLAILGTFLLINDDYLDFNVKETTEWIESLPIKHIVYYVLSLYILSIIWGFISGGGSYVQLRPLLNKLGITSFGINPSVWVAIYSKYRPKDSKTWLKIKIGDEWMVGRLRTSSEYVEMDKAFEIYLERVSVWKNSQWIEKQTSGIYIRLTPEQTAEFFFKDENWKPSGEPV